MISPKEYLRLAEEGVRMAYEGNPFIKEKEAVQHWSMGRRKAKMKPYDNKYQESYDSWQESLGVLKKMEKVLKLVKEQERERRAAFRRVSRYYK